jgi:hypothetical protein
MLSARSSARGPCRRSGSCRARRARSRGASGRSTAAASQPELASAPLAAVWTVAAGGAHQRQATRGRSRPRQGTMDDSSTFSREQGHRSQRPTSHRGSEPRLPAASARSGPPQGQRRPSVVETSGQRRRMTGRPCPSSAACHQVSRRLTESFSCTSRTADCSRWLRGRVPVDGWAARRHPSRRACAPSSSHPRRPEGLQVRAFSTS